MKTSKINFLALFLTVTGFVNVHGSQEELAPQMSARPGQHSAGVPSLGGTLSAEHIKEELRRLQGGLQTRVALRQKDGLIKQLRDIGEEWSPTLPESGDSYGQASIAASSSLLSGPNLPLLMPTLLVNSSSAIAESRIMTSSVPSLGGTLSAAHIKEELRRLQGGLQTRVTLRQKDVFIKQLRDMGEEWSPSIPEVTPQVPMTSTQSSSQTRDYSSDEALARRLQDEENGGIVLPGAFMPAVVMSDQDARAYQIMTDALRIGLDADVHALTRAAGAHYPTIKRLEQKYLHYTNHLSAQNITDGRTRFLADLDGPDFRAFFRMPQGASQVQMQIAREFAAHDTNARALLERNKGFWNVGAQDVDGETGQSLREVFAHAYQAACHLDNLRGGMEYRGYFCLQLSDNYAYNGGCHPGITGRLIELYRQILALGLEA